ncbi:phosphatidylserine decarboxylase proenzyme, mitochondrial-like isoform X1 [Daphnia pulicaria]|uniref:phosphatidylserine decarboxylase proenzyme, mitochondrial-like isoform X1 n=1 Tax=Daphnia pulicaria TaxID=35523 RepID=UPI001EEA95A6|nr:phosphatidylserine decarboxylase proenzyme, mitochondrial-like isoform X1 [Daphnia pulicaria]
MSALFVRVPLTAFRVNLHRVYLPRQQKCANQWMSSSWRPGDVRCINVMCYSTGPLTRSIFRRSVSSSSTGESGDVKTTIAATAATTAAFKGAKNSRWRRFIVKPFVYVQFFFGIGLLALAFQQFRRKNAHPDQSPELIAKDWEVLYYRIIPFRAISRAWGWLTNRHLPVWARQPILGLYARTFNCNLEEALDGNLENYSCLAEFFRRKLKSGVRPIEPASSVVAPSDGTVLNFGRVTAGMMEQVKGVSYSLGEFLGPAYWRNGPEVQPAGQTELEYEKSLLVNKDNDLFHCVIYLAPGDYHCFHSPVDWTVNFRRHFPGALLSVNPSIAKWVAGLFSLNERAVYVGRWAHGFFSMTPVGATNVGSIRVYADEKLRTNCTKWALPLPYYDRYMCPEDSDEIPLKKGEIFGEFNLGSTIVLIFEAPKDFEFKIRPGEKIRMGQSLHFTHSATEASD